MGTVSEQSQCMGRRKDPILIYPRAFISSSGNQPESGCKWMSKGALCVIQWAVSSRVRLNYQNGPFLTLKSASVSQSSLRPFCSVLMMSERCSVNVNHEGCLLVHIWVARHASFRESITRVLCIMLEMRLRGETRFVEVGASFCTD